MGLIIRLGVVWVMAGAIMALSGCAIQCKTWGIDKVEEKSVGGSVLNAWYDWMFVDKKERA